MVGIALSVEIFTFAMTSIFAWFCAFYFLLCLRDTRKGGASDYCSLKRLCLRGLSSKVPAFDEHTIITEELRNFQTMDKAMGKQKIIVEDAGPANGRTVGAKTFFIVPARDSSLIASKARELENLGYPYVIVCGDKVDLPNVVHRPPRGKYDAMNFGLQFVPPNTEVVVFNDVDTQIHNLEAALHTIKNDAVSLVFSRVKVAEGPQLSFYMILDPLRRRLPIAASGELMLIKKKDLMEIVPLRACKAEDSYILFRILGAGKRAVFSQECYVTTQRTAEDKEEETYKRRTVGGIYQALAMTRAPVGVRFFYMLLPLASPVLLIMGRKGLYWMKGIVSGFVDYARGDRSATWKPIFKP